MGVFKVIVFVLSMVYLFSMVREDDEDGRKPYDRQHKDADKSGRPRARRISDDEGDDSCGENYDEVDEDALFEDSDGSGRVYRRRRKNSGQNAAFLRLMRDKYAGEFLASDTQKRKSTTQAKTDRISENRIVYDAETGRDRFGLTPIRETKRYVGASPEPAEEEPSLADKLRLRSLRAWRNWAHDLYMRSSDKSGSRGGVLQINKFVAHPLSPVARINPFEEDRDWEDDYDLLYRDPSTVAETERRKKPWFDCRLVRCNFAILDRAMPIRCDIQAKRRIEITAPCVFHGNITAGHAELKDAGNILGNVAAEALTISGTTLIEGDITAGTLIAQECFSAGDVKAKNATFLISAYSGTLKTLKAVETLTVSQTGNEDEGRLFVENAAAETVRVNGLDATLVRGRDVVIGPNCSIDTVYYRSHLIISPDAMVKNIYFIAPDGTKKLINPDGRLLSGYWLRDVPSDADGLPIGDDGRGGLRPLYTAGYDYTVREGGVRQKTLIAGYDYTVTGDRESARVLKEIDEALSAVKPQERNS